MLQNQLILNKLPRKNFSMKRFAKVDPVEDKCYSYLKCQCKHPALLNLIDIAQNS